jgi:crotonobetainyl-CoA:carnitine CoA-transferase CaiB-like acyl-CoA transferase
MLLEENVYVAALDATRVIDAGRLVQGPQAAATLCEWGADVNEPRSASTAVPTC